MALAPAATVQIAYIVTRVGVGLAYKTCAAAYNRLMSVTLDTGGPVTTDTGGPVSTTTPGPTDQAPTCL
jgi:hypothetical protein